MSEVKLEMKEIIKEFPGVRALDNVTFTVYKGEVLALLGENGAGKSTLMKIVSGVYPFGSYQGQISIDGKVCKFASTKEAEGAGVAIIHQELNLIPGLSIAENIFLGREPKSLSLLGIIDWDSMYQKTQELLNRLRLPFHPRQLVSALSVGQQQMVEIAKALSLNADILVLDEPTSALTESEVAKLFEIIKELRNAGVTMIYISHKLDEIFEIADRVTVLRDGSSVASALISDVTRNKLVSLMVGRDINQLFPKSDQQPGGIALRVEGYSVQQPGGNGYVIEDVSFVLHSGEVVGFAGLMGSGRTELFTSLFGVSLGKTQGTIEIEGQQVLITTPQDAIRHGMAFVTEDRKQSGLVLGMTVKENTSMSSLSRLSSRIGVIDEQQEERLAQRFIKELRTKTPSSEAIVNNLSGGNQQKVVISKWLSTKPKILIMDEPTRGIDVGAKVEIYQLINQLAQEGVAIIMISSELQEIVGMSDRVIVMKEGRIAGELQRAQATQESIMQYATGGV